MRHVANRFQKLPKWRQSSAMAPGPCALGKMRGLQLAELPASAINDRHSYASTKTLSNTAPNKRVYTTTLYYSITILYNTMFPFLFLFSMDQLLL